MSIGTAAARGVNAIGFGDIKPDLEWCGGQDYQDAGSSSSGNGIARNFPPKETTGFPQRICICIAKDNEVFRLQYNNEIVFIASDRHFSPRLDKTINRIDCY
jgi:hypothetical protein